MILGTAAYMSPEQAQGKAVDKRTDIWAFGVVLFEMLTGRRLFGGETITDTLSAVLRDRIDCNTLPADLPANLRTLMRRCLDRDRRQRLRDIGEARIAIESALAGRDANISAEEITRDAPVVPRWLLWAAAALLSAAGLLAGWLLGGSPSSALQPLARVAIPLSPAAPVALDTQHPALAISPDGKRIVYVADIGGKRQLYVREIDQTEVRAIQGTEGACSPFFSPDGHWVGFFDGWVMKKIPLGGGAPVALAIVPPVTRGATWAPDDHIYFASNPNGGLARFPSRGNAPAPVHVSRHTGWEDDFTSPDSAKGEYSHRWPQVLPGGQAILFTIDTGGSFDNARISVLNLKTRETKVLIEGGTCARYARSGHLVFARAGALLTVPFDLDRLAVAGEPVTVISNVAMDQEGAANFDVSDDGMLVYISGPLASTKRRLAWVSRGGEMQPLPAPAREYMQPTLSPDGRRLAVTIPEGSNYDIWLSDTDRGNLTRLTVHPDEDFNAVWTPNGRVVTISSESSRPGPQLVAVAVDGSGAPERLIPNAEASEVHCPGSYASGGQALVFSKVDQKQDPESWRGTDLLVVELDGDRKPRSIAETRFNEHSPVFSPDGHWLAYVSDETGRDEVYRRPYPGSGGKLQISTEGGGEPIWHPSGRELFYRNGYQMMAVTIQLSPTFAVGRPVLLFEKHFAVTHRPEVRQNYDISPDGKRFLMIQNEQETTAPKLDLVLNWFAELRRVTAASR